MDNAAVGLEGEAYPERTETLRNIPAAAVSVQATETHVVVGPQDPCLAGYYEGRSCGDDRCELPHHVYGGRR